MVFFLTAFVMLDMLVEEDEKIDIYINSYIIIS